MHMARGSLAGVDERVEPVDDDLGATETQHGRAATAAELRSGLGHRREREQGAPEHRDGPRWIQVGFEGGLDLGGTTAGNDGRRIPQRWDDG